jgi:hypothetical protein
MCSTSIDVQHVHDPEAPHRGPGESGGIEVAKHWRSGGTHAAVGEAQRCNGEERWGERELMAGGPSRQRRGGRGCGLAPPGRLGTQRGSGRETRPPGHTGGRTGCVAAIARRRCRQRRGPAPQRHPSREGRSAACAGGRGRPGPGSEMPAGAWSSTAVREGYGEGRDNHCPHAVCLCLDDEAIEEGGGGEGEEDLPMRLPASGAQREQPQSPTAKASSASARGSAKRAKKRGRTALASDAKASTLTEGPAVALSQLGGLQPDEGAADRARDYLRQWSGTSRQRLPRSGPGRGRGGEESHTRPVAPGGRSAWRTAGGRWRRSCPCEGRLARPARHCT